MRLLAAMSGGVDSSVAAALALGEGHEVVGVTLKQWDDPDEVVRRTKGCSFVDAAADARRAADALGIPHYTLNFMEVFDREVIRPFVEEYAAGRTPNPCVRCNELVRFGALADKAEALGFDAIVTGHYARVVRDGDGTWRLYRAADAAKDQSYVLHALGQRALARARFPLGEMPSKTDTRRLASELGLPNADREDSVEVCFVPEGRRPGDLVSQRLPVAVRRGPIVDRDGNVVGEHRGLAYYTVGQRKGLGAVRAPGCGTAPRYVAEIDAERNAILVDAADGVRAGGLVATRPRFVTGSSPTDGTRVAAVVRYQGAERPATFTSTADGFRLDFDEPARAVAPGQAVVLYGGDEVLGGGTIDRSL